MSGHKIYLDDAKAVGETITSEHFGANYVYNWEQFGDKPWEKYDELISMMGISDLRYPGGNEIETVFDFTNPNSTTTTTGQSATPLNEFLEFSGENDLGVTIIMPTRPFLPGESHAFVTWGQAEGRWVADRAKVEAAKADVKKFIRDTLIEARANGVDITHIEIGNEYPGVDWTTPSGKAAKMSANQYGVIANDLAKMMQEAISEFNASYPDQPQDPQVVAQVWGDYNQNNQGLNYLEVVNDVVLGEFDTEGFASIDAVATHMYFKDQKLSGEGDQHSYETLSSQIDWMIGLTDVWDQAAGRDLDILLSEWSVQKHSNFDPGFGYWNTRNTWTVSQDWLDHSHFGLKQIAPMLEMFSSFVAEGVDSTHVWSVMYSASAMGVHTEGGRLLAGGEIMKIMQENLIGTRYLETDAQNAHHDVHAFSGNDEGHVFISSLQKGAQQISLDLNSFDGNISDVTIEYIRADMANADGQFKVNGNTYVLPGSEFAYLEADLSVVREAGDVVFDGSELQLELGAFEVAYINFDVKDDVPDDEFILLSSAYDNGSPNEDGLAIA